MTDKRLIDAGTLKAGFEMDGYKSPYVERLIDACPTVDAVPVVHAQWMLEPRERCIVVCSNCHAGCFSRTPYCPLCGAKMDGGVGK